MLAVLWVILEQRRSSPAVETLPAAESNARRNTLLSVGNRHRGICRPKPHRGIRSRRRRRGCAASLLPRAIPTETRAWYTLACISTYRIPRIAPPPVRCDYAKPNRERSFGNSGRGFRERSRFDHSSLRPPPARRSRYPLSSTTSHTATNSWRRIAPRYPALQHSQMRRHVPKDSAPLRHSRTRRKFSRVDEWRSSPVDSTEQIRILRVLHSERIWFMRRAEAVESSCSKLSLKQPNEAQGLAGSHRLGQLPGGLARRLIAWCRRARCWRVLVRSCGYSSEKRAARFFKRIFRHSIGLFHLGLLISSSFVSRSASSPTT